MIIKVTIEKESPKKVVLKSLKPKKELVRVITVGYPPYHTLYVFED